MSLFLNVGHALDHLLMLIFPTVVLAMGAELGRGYADLLPLSLGGFIAFGAFSIPAGGPPHPVGPPGGVRGFLFCTAAPSVPHPLAPRPPPKSPRAPPVARSPPP